MRGGMVLSILALVVLILVTPSLLGRRSSELASLPLLVIGMDRNESAFIVNIGAVVQAYQYDLVRMTLNGSVPSVNRTYEENETFGFHVWVPSNVTFSLHVYLLDQLVDQRRNYFEYNVSVDREMDSQNRTVMVFTFPYERDRQGAPIRITRPDGGDLHLVIPARGTVP